MNNKIDYAEKIVYMGIDVHKKTYCCVSICEGEIVKRTSTRKPHNKDYGK